MDEEDDIDAALAWLEESQRLLWEDQKAYELWLDSLVHIGGTPTDFSVPGDVQ